MDWEIVDSRSEKGVSGYKVSANDRDAIIDIRKAATDKWFISNGIEVWSTQEGQGQCHLHLLRYFLAYEPTGVTRVMGCPSTASFTIDANSFMLYIVTIPNEW